MTVNRANEVAANICYFRLMPDHDASCDYCLTIATAIQSEVDAAVRAENERCALVAESHTSTDGACPESIANVEGYRTAVKQITEAIRLSKLEK
jgi:hypothetical protein